jgi:hypothetical protein
MTVEIKAEVLARFNSASLAHGNHAAGGEGCAMEWASVLAGESWSDHPRCVCPVIGAAYRRGNDSMPVDLRNELLKDTVVMALGTRSTRQVEQRRAFMAADWAVRWAAPRALRACGRDALALQLESLAEIVNIDTARAAYAAAYAAASASASAYAAASDAAYAAYAAAYAANAYAYAAYAAASASAASASAKREVWASFCDLLVRMCAVTA